MQIFLAFLNKITIFLVLSSIWHNIADFLHDFCFFVCGVQIRNFPVVQQVADIVVEGFFGMLGIRENKNAFLLFHTCDFQDFLHFFFPLSGVYVQNLVIWNMGTQSCQWSNLNNKKKLYLKQNLLVKYKFFPNLIKTIKK